MSEAKADHDHHNRGIGRGALAGSVGIFAGRISGLVRDVVFAGYLGTGTALAAFLLAFTLPNMMRRFLRPARSRTASRTYSPPVRPPRARSWR
jgi:hypothetical protein